MTRIRPLLSSALAVACLAGQAMAAGKQDMSVVKSPQTPWLAYAVAIVAVAGVCFVAFRKPKRSKGQ